MTADEIEIPSVRVGRQNSMNLLKQLLKHCNTVDCITIFTYSITDGWMRQLMKVKREKSVAKIILILDRVVMIRHREKLNQLKSVADEVYLTDSHAKLYFVESPGFTAVAITSANATNNYRNECYYITDRASEIRQLRADIRTILGNSSRIV